MNENIGYHFENIPSCFSVSSCLLLHKITRFKMHNILQTFNILYRMEFIFVQISIQGWIDAAHLFPKPSGSNGGWIMDQFTIRGFVHQILSSWQNLWSSVNRISFFLLIQVPIKVTMNQNLLHPVLTDAHSLISRGDLNQKVHPIIAGVCNGYFASSRELSRRL